MKPDIQAYNHQQSVEDQAICNVLATHIDTELKEATSKIWHAHPVWFLNENPVVGYSKQKKGIRLMFWSGADFDEERLNIRGKKFKDASIWFTDMNQLDETDIRRWIKKSREIQWDYKNLIKRKGKLEKLT